MGEDIRLSLLGRVMATIARAVQPTVAPLPLAAGTSAVSAPTGGTTNEKDFFNHGARTSRVRSG